MVKGRSNYSKMWEYFLFGSLKNYSNLSKFSVELTVDLSNGFPPPFVASSLYWRSLFRIKQWVEVIYTKVLVFVEATGRGLPSKPNRRTFLGSFLDDGFRHKSTWFASFGIRASVLVSGLSIPFNLVYVLADCVWP